MTAPCGCPIDRTDGNLQTGPDERWGFCDAHLYRWPVPVKRAKHDAWTEQRWRNGAMALCAHRIVGVHHHAAS
jgi:hypothetical protein